MDYKKMTMDKLKDLCITFNLPIDGKKNDLIKRLIDNDKRKLQILDFDSSKTDDLKSIRPSLDNKRYIRTKIENVYRYINAGVIYPLSLEVNSTYKNENRKFDLFNHVEDYIPVLTEPIAGSEGDDILIEFWIDGLDFKKRDNNILQFVADPIPISRINRILFLTEEQRKSAISSSKIFPDFYLSDSICFVLPTSHKSNSKELDLSFTPEKNSALDTWSSILAKYDRLLGLFGFMKNAGIFYSDKDGQYQEFTPSFFGALSILNKAFGSTGQKTPTLFEYILLPDQFDSSTTQRRLFKIILDKIENNVEFSNKVGHDILETLLLGKTSDGGDQDITLALSYLTKLQTHQTTYSEMFSHPAIRQNLALMALLLLIRFPNRSRQHTDKQAARLFFISNDLGFTKSNAEFLLAVLGLYYGYKKMIKEDTNLNLTDRYFAAQAINDQSIKFRLDRRIDMVIVETIYEWSKIRQSFSRTFDFISETNKRQLNEGTKKIGSLSYVHRTISIVGSNFTIIDRISQSQVITELISKSYPQQISGKSLALSYLINLAGVDKRLLMALVAENKDKIDYEILETLIHFDQKK